MLNAPVECGNPHLLKLSSSSDRSVSKDWLRAILRDGKSFCAWCNLKELAKFRSKYCSKECLETSSAFCSPQTNPQSFYFLLKRQNNQCAHCKFDYGETLKALHKEKTQNTKKRIQRKIESLKDLPIEQANKLKPLIQKDIKKFNKQLQSDFLFDIFTPKKIRKLHRKLKDHRQPEVDHLKPIGAGGSALGFENLQLLCYKCHKVKTSQDIVLIRAAKKGLKG